MGGGGRCLTALEADGARRLGNESFVSAPQLKRDPLGRHIAAVRIQVKAAPILLLVLASCRAGTRDESSSEGTTTKASRLPHIVEITPITWSGAWGTGLRI